jgi:hypothetical protein
MYITTIHALSRKSPSIPWLSIFRNLFHMTSSESTLIALGGEEDLQYFASLSLLVSSVGLDVLEGYFTLHTVISLAPYAHQALRDNVWRIKSTNIPGVQLRATDRGEFCSTVLVENMNWAVGRYFAAVTLSGEFVECGVRC